MTASSSIETRRVSYGKHFSRAFVQHDGKKVPRRRKLVANCGGAGNPAPTSAERWLKTFVVNRFDVNGINCVHFTPAAGLKMPKMGITIPEMGKLARPRMITRGHRSSEKRAKPARAAMADALFTSTQQRVLGLLYGQPERSFFASELIGLAGSGSGAVQRELTRLVDTGLVLTRSVGRQRHYQANRDAPIYEELRSIIVKTAGFAGPLQTALASLAPRITLALLYGSVARGTATATSDIDLLIVADELTLEDVYAALSHVERQLARKVSPTLYTVEEFRRRRKKGNSFLARVISGPHLVLTGDLNAIETAR